MILASSHYTNIAIRIFKAQSHYLKRGLFVGMFILGLAPSAGAGPIVNGGFENDYAGWESLGKTSVVGATFGTGPAEGLRQALLETSDSSGGAATLGDLDLFLGLEAGALDNLSTSTFGGVIGGSAIKQTFSAAAGDVVSINFNYLTNDDVFSLDQDFNDFAFLYIGSPALLADGTTPGFMVSSTPIFYETGFQSFSYSIPTSGEYTFGVGVVNVGDNFGNSAILLDNVRLIPAAVPEPTSFGLLMVGALTLSGYIWLRGTNRCPKA